MTNSGLLKTFDEIIEYIGSFSELILMDVHFLVGDDEYSIKMSKLRNLLILPVTSNGYPKTRILLSCCFYLQRQAKLRDSQHLDTVQLQYSMEYLHCLNRLYSIEPTYFRLNRKISNTIRHQLYAIVRINRLQDRVDNQIWWCMDKNITSIISHIATKGDQRLRDVTRAHFLEIKKVAPMIYQELVMAMYKLEWLPDNIEDVLGIDCDLLIQLGIIE